MLSRVLLSYTVQLKELLTQTDCRALANRREQQGWEPGI